MTKRDRITEKAKELLSSKPEGLRFGQLRDALKKAFPEEPEGNITGAIWNLHIRFPKEIYKAGNRQPFRLTKYRSTEELQADLAAQREFAITITDFRDAMKEIGSRHPNLKRDDLFVLWFLVANLTDDEDLAAKALVGGAGDKGIDAIWIDDFAKAVFIVQGKFRETLGEKYENRNDVLGILDVARHLTETDDKKFKSYLNEMEPLVAAQLPAARKRFLDDSFRVVVCYVTLGKVADTIRNDANLSLAYLSPLVSMEIFDSTIATVVMRNYLDDVPSIPACSLEIEIGDQVKVVTIAERHDEKNRIECWVLSMRGDKIAALIEQVGIRLFARNVRGYLGQKRPVNEAMKDTLENEPGLFFYYNNGITILCADAESKKREGKETLHVTQPQIINGQQTARTLAAHPSLAAHASVLVKVIAVKQRSSDDPQFTNLLGNIVAGTNYQSPIKQSDLRSNDRIQVALARSLRKLGYGYIRKQETGGEAKVRVGGKEYHRIKKEVLAQAVVACEFDGYHARSSSDTLFDEHWYKLLFSGREPFFYLSRYWLMKQVRGVLTPKDARREVRWLVVSYVWLKLTPFLKGVSQLRRFSEQCQTGDKAIVEPLEKAIDIAAGAAMKFYEATKGKGEDEVDLPTFFKSKRSSLTGFGAYLKSSGSALGGFEKQITRVAQAIAQ